jgi:LysR family transcriptional regulator, hydrogen peroxide-inducible genes activator
MPTHHRLSARSTIRLDDLRNETLLLLEDGHCLRDQALDICSTVDVHEKQDFRATSLETLRQMVASGVGITLLPELAGRGAYGAARGVVIKPFVKPVPTRTIGAVWRKSSARREVILALAKQIEAHAL